MEVLGCSKLTAMKIMKELDSETGLGLIERLLGIISIGDIIR